MGEAKLHVAVPSCQVCRVSITDPRVRAAYSEGAGIYRILPSAVAIPEDTSAVVAVLRRAAQSRTAVIPRGAGSGMPGGNVGSGMIVDMSGGVAGLGGDPPPPERAARGCRPRAGGGGPPQAAGALLPPPHLPPPVRTT